jgi:hypothetical protein
MKFEEIHGHFFSTLWVCLEKTCAGGKLKIGRQYRSGGCNSMISHIVQAETPVSPLR